jgi:hypothetical protein
MMPFPPTDWSSSPSLTARNSFLLVSANCLVCLYVCVHACPSLFLGFAAAEQLGFLFSLGRCCFLHALFVVSNQRVVFILETVPV